MPGTSPVDLLEEFEKKPQNNSQKVLPKNQEKFVKIVDSQTPNLLKFVYYP